MSSQDWRETAEAVATATQGVLQEFSREYYLSRAASGGDTQEMWKAMAQQGLLGLGVPEEYGGSGESVVGPVAFVEAMSAAGLPPVFTMATSFSRAAILAGGTEDQRQKYVPDTVTGEKRICFGLTEPDAGSNSFAIKTRATKVDGGYSISGQKVFISHVDHSDHMMLVAKISDDGEKDDFGIFLIDLPAEGLTMQQMKIEMFAPDHRFQLFLDNVFVPEENRVGAAGTGKKLLFSALNPERFMVAAMSLGLGQLMVKKGVDYAKERAPFGTPIGAYQAIAHPLAWAEAHLQAARLVIYQGAYDYENGIRDASQSNLARLLASEAANQAVEAAIQAYGGAAFDQDSDIVTHWPHIRLQRIAPVSDQMILNHLSHAVLKLPKSY